MSVPRLSIASLASATVLVALTIGVFAAQGSVGPETAIKHFHQGIKEAVTQRDFRNLDRTLMGGVNSSGSRMLIDTAYTWLYQRKGKYEILRSRPAKDNDRLIFVTVRYSDGKESGDFVYLVRRVRNVWMIDSDGTVQYGKGAL